MRVIVPARIVVPVIRIAPHHRRGYGEKRRRIAVHVALVGRLIRVIDRKLVATVTADAKTQANEDRLREVLAAFERASHEAILDLGRGVSRLVADDAQTLRTARGDESASR